MFNVHSHKEYAQVPHAVKLKRTSNFTTLPNNVRIQLLGENLDVPLIMEEAQN